MGVAGQDHVNALDAADHLAVDVKAVVRQTNDKIDAVGADLVHHFLHPLLADAKAVFGEHPFRVGDGHVGESLPDHGNPQAALFENLVGLEGRFVPFGVKDVGAEEGEGQRIDQFFDPLGAKGPFPMAGHRLYPKGVHHVDHVLTLGHERGHGAMPGITAIQKDAVRSRGADRLDHGRHAVHAAHLAIGLSQRVEILIGQRVGFRAGRDDVEHLQEIRPRHMRRLALGLADAQVDLGFTKPDRFDLCVNVGDVDQRNVTEIIELQQLVLGQGLLGCQLRPVAEPRNPDDGRGCNRCLQELTAGDHDVSPQHLLHKPTTRAKARQADCPCSTRLQTNGKRRVG